MRHENSQVIKKLTLFLKSALQFTLLRKPNLKSIMMRYNKNIKKEGKIISENLASFQDIVQSLLFKKTMRNIFGDEDVEIIARPACYIIRIKCENEKKK